MYGDENPDLHKQMGCMNGFFQIFDRNNFVVGRCLNGLSRKRLTSGYAGLHNRSNEAKKSACSSQIMLDKNLSKSLNETRGVSMESSRASCSSLSSSSFSSAEFNKSIQQDASSFDRVFFQERSSKSSDFDAKSNCSELGSNTPVSSTQSRRDVLDFRNAVKGSMQRESQKLSIKTSLKEEMKHERVKYKDSPRPTMLLKTSDEGAKSSASVDLDKSARVLMKIKESLSKHGTKGTPMETKSYLSPRFSCDGRELSSPKIDSQGKIKSSDKLGQLSRLSLDSREGSPKISNFYSRANSLMEDSNLDQDHYRRSPSVVARLMGLDELPDTLSTPKVPDTKPDMLSYSPKSNLSDSAIQKLRNRGMHPKNNSMITETVSRFQQDQDCIAQNAKQKKLSVYGEIEKRLNRLEFRHSKNDLNALKQLLGSVNLKNLSQRNETYGKQPEMTIKDYHRDETEKQDCRLKRSADSPRYMTKTSGTAKTFSSPIVIMKPAKSLSKSGSSVATCNSTAGLLGLPKLRTSNTDDGIKMSKNYDNFSDQSPKIGQREHVLVLLSTDKQSSTHCREDNVQKYHSNLEQSLSEPQDTKRLKNVSSSLSSKLQQQKFEAEKKSYPSNSIVNKAEVQPKSRQLASKVRMKRSQAQKDNDQKKMICSEKDEICQRSINSTSLASISEAEKNSTRTSAEVKLSFQDQEMQAPSNKNSKQNVYETTPVKLANISPAQRLDASLFQDASEVSLVKERSNTLNDDLTRDLRLCCQSVSLLLAQLTNTNAEDAEANLIQKLDMVSSADNESHTAHCDTVKYNINNPDSKYVLEILFATGLLGKDQKFISTFSNPFDLQSSGHAVNPDMFYVLEQSKHGLCSMLESVQEHAPKKKLNPQKLHRRLIFDSVNEMLTNKMVLVTYSSLCHHMLLQTKKQSGEQLLQELCSEIERLQTDSIKLSISEDDDNCTSGDDVVHQSGWAEFNKERDELALEIERLVYRDLIDETVNAMTVTVSTENPNKLRRKLFTTV